MDTAILNKHNAFETHNNKLILYSELVGLLVSVGTKRICIAAVNDGVAMHFEPLIRAPIAPHRHCGFRSVGELSRQTQDWFLAANRSHGYLHGHPERAFLKLGPVPYAFSAKSVIPQVVIDWEPATADALGGFKMAHAPGEFGGQLNEWIYQ
jgi:hypothetical protein